MARKNYKLIAKKQLEKLNNDYEELKIKSQVHIMNVMNTFVILQI